MSFIRKTLVAAASTLALAGALQAQTTTERDRGVPGVDVDVGRNAQGAIDVDRTTRDSDRTMRDTNRGAPGVDVDVGRNARGAVDVDRERAARADRG
jgi:hypothetical protein